MIGKILDELSFIIFLGVCFFPFWLVPTLIIYDIYKEMKAGKPFKAALCTAFKKNEGFLGGTGGSGHHGPSSSGYGGYSSTDFTSNPSFRSLPGNSSHRS